MRLAALAVVLLLAAQGAAGAERADRRESVRHPNSTTHQVIPDGDDEDFEGYAVDTLHTRDSDRFRSMQVRAGALIDHRSAYDFIALLGGGTRYEQDAWSIDRYTLAGAIRKQERNGAGLLATAGVSTIGDHLKWIGEGTYNVRLSPSAGIEFVGQREFIETRASIESGTMTNFLAASADWVVTERLTLIGLAGGQWFSDDNQRKHLRGRAIYTLLPEQGLSMQVRARGYESSRAGGGLYFNPEHYERADIGLRLRRAIWGWRMLAAAGGGRERIERDIEKPTRYADLRIERSFANKVTVAMTYSASKSSESDSTTGTDYIWRYFRAVLIVPL